MNNYRLQNNTLYAGVDEAGRGCLCGNVVVAAVILDSTINIEGLNDSKKLTESKRKLLAKEIIANALAYRIENISPDTIDKINILQASLLGMKQAVEALYTKPQLVYVDGNHAPKLDIPVVTVIKGDQLIKSISAASILAKVTRDEQMMQLHEKLPQYGFNQHKGYPTKLHMEKISKYGILDCYRKTYKPVRELIENA
ncbi:MAG: ribonuclease HII [Gammaproteobacteria bacterium]|nr:ribonuclease HII [Gammaproteobacteria bacterium]